MTDNMLVGILMIPIILCLFILFLLIVWTIFQFKPVRKKKIKEDKFVPYLNTAIDKTLVNKLNVIKHSGDKGTIYNYEAATILRWYEYCQYCKESGVIKNAK